MPQGRGCNQCVQERADEKVDVVTEKQRQLAAALSLEDRLERIESLAHTGKLRNQHVFHEFLLVPVMTLREYLPGGIKVSARQFDPFQSFGPGYCADIGFLHRVHETVAKALGKRRHLRDLVHGIVQGAGGFAGEVEHAEQDGPGEQQDESLYGNQHQQPGGDF